jgi:peptidoglycan/LPS O-acetylase OafA/YrhL
MVEKGKSYNANIEALRGFAALCVVLDHVIIWSDKLNPGFDFREKIIPYAFPGHLMVLIFFILSGYVIGLTNKTSNVFDVKKYIKKRLVRLYPIYLFAVCLTVVLFSITDWKDIMGNVFFLQNVVVRCFDQNTPLWSLNHEIIYYALAIPLLYGRFSVVGYSIVIGISLVISLLWFPVPLVMEGYMVGFLFWLSGFWLSQSNTPVLVDESKFVSVFVLLLGCSYLNSATVVLSKLPLHHGENVLLDVVINIEDFGLYFACVYAMLVFTGKFRKQSKWFFSATVLISLSHLAILLKSGSFFNNYVFVLPAVFILVSLFQYFIPFPNFSLNPFVWMGKISYAMYVIHAPLLFAFGYITFFSGNLLTYIVRLVLFFVISFGLAYFLELKLQPIIKKVFTT